MSSSSYTIEDLIADNSKLEDWSKLGRGALKHIYRLDFYSFVCDILDTPFEELEEGEIEDNAYNLMIYAGINTEVPENDIERKYYYYFIQRLQIACKDIDRYIKRVVFESNGTEEIHTMKDIFEYEYEAYCVD